MISCRVGDWHKKFLIKSPELNSIELIVVAAAAAAAAAVAGNFFIVRTSAHYMHSIHTLCLFCISISVQIA